MKKVCIILVGLSILTAVTILAVSFMGESSHSAFLRLHIRANSNTTVDQNIKYQIKEEVTTFLTPVVANCHTKDESMQAVQNNLKNIEELINTFLQKSGFRYTARAALKREEFPTRVYEGVTLPAGVYDALIIELGTGKGDNWWCVLYPPLCFAGSMGVNIQYRVKIWEIIQNFFAN